MLFGSVSNAYSTKWSRMVSSSRQAIATCHSRSDRADVHMASVRACLGRDACAGKKSRGCSDDEEAMPLQSHAVVVVKSTSG
jgi:hypothetical protein